MKQTQKLLLISSVICANGLEQMNQANQLIQQQEKINTDQQSDLKAKTSIENKAQSEIKTDTKSKVESQTKTEVKTEAKSESKTKATTESKSEQKSKTKTKTKSKDQPQSLIQKAQNYKPQEGTRITSDDIQKAAQEIEQEEQSDQKIKQEIENDQGGLSANQLKIIGNTIDDDNKTEDPNGAYSVEPEQKQPENKEQKPKAQAPTQTPTPATATPAPTPAPATATPAPAATVNVPSLAATAAPATPASPSSPPAAPAQPKAAPSASTKQEPKPPVVDKKIMDAYNQKRLAEQARDARINNEDMGNDANNQPKQSVKDHKVYKRMTKRFLAKKDWEDEEYGPYQMTYARHKNEKDPTFEEGDESEKEKEGYLPNENENDGLDRNGQWYHDQEYAKHIRYMTPYDYERYNKQQDTGAGGGMKFRDSSDDRKKKEEGAAKEGGDAAKKDTGKSNGLPAELDPNFGKLVQKKKMKAHQQPASLVQKPKQMKKKPKKKPAKKTAVKKHKKKVIQEEEEEESDSDLDQDDGAIAQAVKQKQIEEEEEEEEEYFRGDKKKSKKPAKKHKKPKRKVDVETEEDLEEDEQVDIDNQDQESEDEDQDEETNVLQKEESDDEEMEDEEQVQVKQKTKAKSKAKSKKKSHNTDGMKAWEDVSTVLSADTGFMAQEARESHKLDHKNKRRGKTHKHSIEHVQVLSQNATLPAFPAPDENTPAPPEPAPQPDDDAGSEDQLSPNGSVEPEETEEEKAEKAKEAAKKEQELKDKKEKEKQYTIARDQAISLQGEFQALQAKTTAMDTAAAKARDAALKLRIAMGAGSDVEADLAAEELGIKQGDAAKIAGKSANATNSTSNSTAAATNKGSGVSVVSFAVPTSEEADILVQKLFKDQLIADAQISASNTHRMYMRYKKLQETDNIVKMRLVTSDSRVPALIRYLILNNPNGSDTEVVPSIVSQQMNSGSPEYVSWVKNQTKQSFATENGDKLNDVINDLEGAVATSKEQKPDDEEGLMVEETAGDAKIEKKEEKPQSQIKEKKTASKKVEKTVEKKAKKTEEKPKDKKAEEKPQEKKAEEKPQEKKVEEKPSKKSDEQSTPSEDKSEKKQEQPKKTEISKPTEASKPPAPDEALYEFKESGFDLLDGVNFY